MSKYTQSLAILDKLIARLQANTGGEPLLPEDKVGQKSAKEDAKGDQAKKKDPEVKEEKGKKQKKQVEKKKKEEVPKQPKGKEGEKKKLPQGVDPDLLIFNAVDMRVSDMIQAWKHPESDYLFCEKIQVGKELRTIASGLQDHYKAQDMIGRVIVMANLKPRTMGGFQSNGMVVCASDSQNKSFQILRPVGDVGERLFLDGYEEMIKQREEIEPIMNKKTLEKFLKQFHTDEEGFVIWKGFKVRTKGGFLQSKFKGGNVS